MNRDSKHFGNSRSKGGYLLLEVVLAMGLFALVATGFTKALQYAADASDLAAREMQVTRILQSSLDEALSLPILEEGKQPRIWKSEACGSSLDWKGWKNWKTSRDNFCKKCGASQ